MTGADLDPDLEALRSVAPWWKRQVQRKRHRERLEDAASSLVHKPGKLVKVPMRDWSRGGIRDWMGT